jgi:hypothetical protein
MQTKLTLRLDDHLIERAKRWAKANDVSLSEVVADLFARLPDDDTCALSDWTRRLVGIARADGEPATDEHIREQYAAYLDAKYSDDRRLRH